MGRQITIAVALGCPYITHFFHSASRINKTYRADFPIHTFEVDGEILPAVSLYSDSRTVLPSEYTDLRCRPLASCANWAKFSHKPVYEKSINRSISREQKWPYIDQILACSCWTSWIFIHKWSHLVFRFLMKGSFWIVFSRTPEYRFCNPTM